VKRVVLIGILLAVCGVLFFFWHRREANARQQLTFSGNIELTEVQMAFKRTGRLQARPLDEGDTVSSGVVVARLERVELERQRDRALAAVAIAESRLAMLEYEIKFQEENLEASLKLRQAELEQAKAALRELLAGSRRQEIAEAQAAVQRAETEWTNARSDWKRIRGLFESGVVSNSQDDSARTRYEAAGAILEQVRQRLALVEEGPRSERVEAATATVERAKAGLQTAQTAEIELHRKRLERQVRQAELNGARAELALIETQLADTVLVAPLTGVVLAKSAEPGEVLAAGTPVVTLGDLDHPWVRAYISEADLGRVRLGDRVRVRTDSFPDKTYWGRVSFLASEAEFTPKQIQTREERTKLVYRVKIDVPNPDHELKLNMPVEGEILPEREPGP